MKLKSAEQIDGILSENVAVLKAWREFKRTHDVASAQIACCARTVKLFQALDALEREIVTPYFK